MHPLRPLWVPGSVWLLVFGFEDTHHFAFAVACEVAARAALGYHLWMRAHFNGDSYALHNVFELFFGHIVIVMVGRQVFDSVRSDAFGGLKDGMMNLELLFLVGLALVRADLEFGRYLVCPSFQSSVYGFDVNS